MKNKILQNLDQPRFLEELYRDNKTEFKREFNLLYPEIKEVTTAHVWNERLNFEQKNLSETSKHEWFYIGIACVFAFYIAQIPHIFGFDAELFYPRNISFIVFPMLSAYFLRKNKVDLKQVFIIVTIFIISAVYINLLPGNQTSDTFVLAYLHLPLFLWSVFGFSFSGGKLHDYKKRLDFLRFNGDLIVITTLILISGGILTAFTVGLFKLIGLNIIEFYSNYIVILGLASAPIVGTFLVQKNPQLVNKISPIIAKVFTPLVLITLIVYLFAVLFAGKDPFYDRNFLIVFNLLLIAVLALILFSLSDSAKNGIAKSGIILLFALSLVTVLVNGIALSAILFRISEWGFTPNRITVLIGNMLILANLLMVTFQLAKTLKNPAQLEFAEKSMASFLPIYSVWTIIVTFIFPLLFGFK